MSSILGGAGAQRTAAARRSFDRSAATRTRATQRHAARAAFRTDRGARRAFLDPNPLLRGAGDPFKTTLEANLSEGERRAGSFNLTQTPGDTDTLTALEIALLGVPGVGLVGLGVRAAPKIAGLARAATAKGGTVRGAAREAVQRRAVKDQAAEVHRRYLAQQRSAARARGESGRGLRNRVEGGVERVGKVDRRLRSRSRTFDRYRRARKASGAIRRRWLEESLRRNPELGVPALATALERMWDDISDGRSPRR